ncbi:MAG: hypothetical protein FJ253_00790 [Phycisphaerae bacterium]|nr:hypothetical protein [Phycisphaerae bacterium]
MMHAFRRILLAGTIAAIGTIATACDGSSSPSSKGSQEQREESKVRKDLHAEKAHELGGASGGSDGSGADDGKGDHKHKDHDKKKDDDRKGDDRKDDKKSGDGSSGAAGSDSKRAHGHEPGPNDIVFYVSMHGDQGGNTLIGLNAKGEVKGSVLRGAPPGDAGESLRDLRGMCLLGDGSILVVNAWMKDTRIVQFGKPGADGVRDFERVFIKGGTGNQGLVHTYSVVVGPGGNIYCSNQDTNTVTRYAGPGAQSPGEPLPAPPSLKSFGSLAPGTFVPNSQTSPQGISEVRGIAFGPDGLLYVADRTGSRVSAYDPQSGDRKAIVASEKDGLKHPIQLAFTPDGKFLFIGDNGANCVWRKDLDSGAITQFVKPGTGGLDAPSAIVVSDAHLFVGSRKTKSILRFKMPEGTLDPHPFVEKLPDNPEFMLKVGGTSGFGT